MKTCHVCGALVDDRELTCPDCGATVVMSTSGLALKANEPVKKPVGNPMGMTMSTGSGLTDILRAPDDNFSDYEKEEFYGGGSIPLTFTKTVIDDGPAKKKKTKVGATVFKILLLCALAYGIYYLVVNVFLNKEGAFSYEEVIDIYVAAVNEEEKGDDIKLIVPPYISVAQDGVDLLMKGMDGIDISNYKIVDTYYYTASDIRELQDSIKLQTSKTANIKDACKVTIRFEGTIDNAGYDVKHSEVDMVFVQIRDRWYLHVDTYDNPEFK